MLKFLIDTQPPPILSRFLKDKGFDAAHTMDYPDGHLLQDTEIIEMAIHHHQIIITKDSDFLDNYLLKGSPPDVLLLEVGNIKNVDLLIIIESNLEAIVEAFEKDAHLIILDRINMTQF
ncbi:MAG: hypothetical protein OHK0053_13940 [Microscillaceae bacterium]